MPTLYVVATPIGNLSDMTPRALETLRSVSLIAAEDTRVTGKLLSKFEIDKPMVSCHRHNEAERTGGLVERMLAEGIDVALTTDAGTPAVSDPGDVLVREAAAAGIRVVPVPGCCAAPTALSACGFSSREFAFYGFLPREKGDLRKKLDEIARGVPVCVVYESPHRVTDLVAVLCEKYADCAVCCCCDLTKLHEKILRGTAREVHAALEENPKTEKGEYCLVLDFSALPAPASETPQVPPQSPEARLLALLFEGVASQEAVARLCAEGVKKNDAKRAAIAVRQWLEDAAER